MSELAILIRLCIRLLAAALAALAIALAQYSSHKPSSLKTHMVVAIAAAVLMLVAKYGFPGMEGYDASNIAAAAVSGISFLGTGLIIKKQANIEGLSSAASIWSAAAIGLAIGGGMYELGICGTILIVLLLLGLHTLEKKRNEVQGAYLLKTDEIELFEDPTVLFGRLCHISCEKTEPHLFEVRIVIRFEDSSQRQVWEQNMRQNERVHVFRYLFPSD